MNPTPIKESIFSNFILKEINRPYGNFYLLDSYVISEINEGAAFGTTEAADILPLLIDFYDGIRRPSKFVYLSNRVFSYAAKPADGLKFKHLEDSIAGYGIVDHRPRSRQNAILEQKFVPCEFDVFDELKQAVRWSLQIQQRLNLN